ncbi:uncharacterized protein LOC133832998 [Humulus lupulus]|uniref:uncharacterized protein LOC133832998 n=1 Tax=Humulus lupulus TaxID=3486 RepID=UPI002B402327|nr:uncharacterized protein LOC133832998 [Humulus lupulus]
MGYTKAWRSREKALRLVRGNPDDSYQKLSMYLHMLKQANPRTITYLLIDKEDRFKYLCIAFSNSIKGWRYLRPIIVVGGTFPKNAHGSTLFSTSTLDSNHNIFVLAFGIANSENDNPWLWFFSKLRDTYGKLEGLAIISDRHKSIGNAVHMVCPIAFHGACMFHLLNNLKSKYGSHGEELQMNFIATVKAYTKTKCECYMKCVDRLDRSIRPYLEMVEGVPIDILIECLRSFGRKLVWTNSNNANATFTKVSTATKNELRNGIVSKMKYEVFPFNPIEYQVCDEKGVNFTVNIHNRTCTCNRFQEDEMFCGHAVAVIAKRNLKVYMIIVKSSTK